MKPHTLRKWLWIGNGLLSAGVVVAVLHGFSPVQQADAADYAQELTTFDSAHRDPWRPRPAVDREDVLRVFRQWRAPPHERAHFPFVGPLPPGLAPELRPAPPDGPPQDLLAIGTPQALLHAPGDHVLLFAFERGVSKAFRVGDWIRADATQAKRFRFIDLQLIPNDPSLTSSNGAFAIHLKYAVHEGGRRQRVCTLVSQNEVQVPDSMRIVDLPSPVKFGAPPK